jgi:plasmid stabilization system protein ParE
MTRAVRWTVTALSDLDETLAYIAGHDEPAAVAVKRRVIDAAERLARHSTGRPSRVSGHFEKPVARTRLTLCYETRPEILLIVRCIHQSRDWQRDGWPIEGPRPQR